MLRFLFCGLLMAASYLYAQTAELTVEPDGAGRVEIHTHYAALDIVPTDEATISVTHSIVVNGKPLPDLSEVTVERRGGTIEVREVGPGEGEIERACSDGRGPNGNCQSRIRLTVRVPHDMQVTAETLYGDVSAAEVTGLDEVHATYGTVAVAFSERPRGDRLEFTSDYGAVDITLPAATPARLTMATEYGSLLTDFDVAIDERSSRSAQFDERLVGRIGEGPADLAIELRSPYDNVYLRRGE